MDENDVINSSLFKEIGHTLETIGRETIMGTVSSLKTAIARRSATTTEGQAVAFQNLTSSFLPLIIVAVVVFVAFKVFGK